MFLLTVQNGLGQRTMLKKRQIMDTLWVTDSIPDTYSLYLPKNFGTDKKWPLLLIFDFEGNKKAISRFVPAAEEEGYVLMAFHVPDSLSLGNTMAKTDKALGKVSKTLPINKSRVYTAGMDSSGRYALLAPFFLKAIKGAIAINASFTNLMSLDFKQPFHFIGIVDKYNHNYTEMISNKKVLDRLKFPNQILLVDRKAEALEVEHLKKAMQIFTLSAMAKGWAKEDSVYVDNAYREDLQKLQSLKAQGKLLLAEQYLGGILSTYDVHKNLDSLKQVQKAIGKDRRFRIMKRQENVARFKESLLRDDYLYFMEEDVRTHNFNNLGWWNYQMGEIDKFMASANDYEEQMGSRLKGYINALAEDNMEFVRSEELIDEDALAFLYMLKTLIEPENFEYYLRIISLSSKNEDYGTALFYMEEALKKGFKDSDRLYGLENTALLRINPKFNKLVATYLKDARYRIIEE